MVGAMVLVLAGFGCNREREPADTTRGGGSTTGTPDACMASSDCSDAFCVAPWDAALGQRGPAECVAECIADDDLTRFCLEDASCCEGSRCNAADGLCARVSEASSSTSAGDSTGASTSGTSTSGVSTSTSGPSTGSSSDTSTG